MDKDFFKNLVDTEYDEKANGNNLSDLAKNMVQTDKTDDAIDFSMLKQYANVLYYEQEIEKDKNNQAYINVIDNFCQNICNNISYVRSFYSDCWKRFIKNCGQAMQKDRDYEKRRADAAKYLKNTYSIKYNYNEDICISSEKEETKILEDLSARIKKYGGRNFIEKLLKDKNIVTYSHVSGRFLVRNKSTFIKKEISTPVNFLLNLAFKHLKSKGTPQNTDYDTIITIAKNFCCIKYPNDHNLFELIYHREKSFEDYCRSLVLKYSIYGFTQSSKNYIIDLSRFLLNTIKTSNNKLTSLEFGFNDIETFLDVISKKCKQNQFVVLDTESCRRVPIKLIQRFSANVESVNQDFISPTDIVNKNHDTKPLIKIGRSYYIAPSTICMMAFFEAFSGLCRDEIKDFDNQLGIYIEDFIKAQLKEVSITPICGNYSYVESGKNNKGESDIIIENTTDIFFVEVKKKTLTRKAQSGSRMDIITDIVKAVFMSQSQALRTSLALKSTNGKLVLNDKQQSYTLQDNNRKHHYITVTLDPFGIIQDNVVFNELIQELKQTTLSPNGITTKETKKLSNLITNINPESFGKHTLLTIEQIYLMLKNHSKHPIFDVLNQMEHQNTQTQDFYSEYENVLL